MNGLVILAIYSLIMQVEVLPNVLAAPRTGAAPSQMYDVGWTTDAQGKLSMILQISPEAIAEFSRGTAGQELPVEVPLPLQGRIDHVIVRIGNTPVERIPSNLQALGLRTNGPAPFLATLNNRSPIDPRTPVTIDPARGPEVLPTSGGLPLANTPQGNFINTQTQTGNANDVMPSGISGNPSGLLPGNVNNNSVMPDPVGNNQSLAGRDNFSSGTRSAFSDLLKGNQTQNTPMSQPFANNTQNPFPNNQNASANPQTPFNNPPYSTANPQTNNRFNQPVFTNSQNVPPNNQQFNSGSNLGQYQPLPNLGTQQPPYANNGNPYLAANTFPNNQFASTRLPGQTTVTPSFAGTELEESAKDKWLPFVLLFSIVGNVYLGLWMSHLRTRYRQLLSNMRGIPVSDLDT